MTKAATAETRQWRFKTKVGDLYLVASAKGLRTLLWEKQPDPMATSLSSSDPAVEILAQAVEELGEYFAGTRRTFTLPLDLSGTAFQQQVWQQLQRIPFGTTNSYKDIAAKLNKLGAMRAVGLANGKNAVCIVVPCHRVIAASGALGGFSAGLERKVLLLEHERSYAKN